MRIIRDGRDEEIVVGVVLSKRNLLTLLTKLTLPGSACTIYKDGIYVSAEADDVHYQGREPGPMIPATERQIAELAEFVEDRKV